MLQKLTRQLWADRAGEKDRPAQSLELPLGRASRLQRCGGSAATEQDLCQSVLATSEVNLATRLDCVLKVDAVTFGRPRGRCSQDC